MIKISIVVPVYNTEKYLKRCLDSILNQSLKEIEVIIVDDGSPDNSAKIIEEYQLQDSRIKLITKKNGGISSARNAGIETANGKYIIHIDSDDWIEQDYFKDVYHQMEKNNLDIIVSDYYLDYDNTDLICKKDLIISEDVVINEAEYLNMFFKGKIAPAVWNKMYKLNLYKDNNIFYPLGLSLGEDLVTTALLASKATRIGKINKSYVHYIQNMGSITKSNPIKKIYELISAFELLDSKLNQKGIINIKISHLSDLIFNSKYNFKEEFYKEALIYYSNLFKKEFEIKSNNKKKKICFILLKISPNLSMLKFILIVNKIGIKIKDWIKK